MPGKAKARPDWASTVNQHAPRYRKNAPQVRGGRSGQKRRAINEQMGRTR